MVPGSSPSQPYRLLDKKAFSNVWFLLPDFTSLLWKNTMFTRPISLKVGMVADVIIK